MSENILIVDDEQDICFLLAGILKAKSHMAVTASSLAEGFEKAKDHKPTLLFLDINLPDGSGLQAISHFKRLLPELKIIMISAYDGSTEREKAASQGAIAFISKPFVPSTIHSTMEEIQAGKSQK